MSIEKYKNEILHQRFHQAKLSSINQIQYYSLNIKSLF